MATYDNDLRLKEITTGDEDGTWGVSTNTNLALIADGFSLGTKQMAADANETFTMPDATADATRSLYLKITSAVSLTATREVTLGPNTVSKTWIIENATSGSQIITIKQGSGATVNVPNGSKVMVVTDGAGAGAAVFNANPTEVGGTVTSIDVSGGTTGLTTSGGPVTTSGTITLAGTLAVANGGTGSTTAAGALTNFGLTATAAELNYTDGVTSNIQTQLDTKAPTASPTFTGTVTIPTADINGGTIDGTVIGGSTAAAGTFTTGQFNTSLNVDGTATMDGLTVDATSTLGQTLHNTSGVSIYTRYQNNSGNDNYIGYTNNNFDVFPNNSKALTVASGGDISFYEDTGTTPKFVWDASGEILGIGGSPNAALPATGTLLQLQRAGSTRLNITAANVSYSAIDFGDTDDLDVGKIEYYHANNTMYFSTNAANRMTINSNGIDVTGEVEADTAHFGTGTGAGPVVADEVVVSGTGSTGLTIHSPDANNATLAFGSVTDNDYAFVQGYYNAGSPFLRFSIQSSEIAKVTSTGIDVTGNYVNSGNLLHNNNSGLKIIGGGDATNAGSNLTLYGGSNASAGTFRFRNGTATYLEVAGNGDISFYEDTGTTPKFFWDASAERLGIGTSSPTRALHVNSGAANEVARFESTDTEVLIELVDTTGSAQIRSRNDLRFYTNGGSTRAMDIDSSGNVGIGTASPDYRLEVEEAGTGSGLGGIAAATATAGGSAGYRWVTGGTFRFAMTTIGSAGSESLRIYDNNNTTERMRIDSSGTLLVGKTGAGTNTAGSQIDPTGRANFTVAANFGLLVNRLTSDGELARFQKDGATVGSIGINSNIYLVGASSGLRIRANDIIPVDATGAGNDNALDLGIASQRWKDLYLSGGVYLGGTGAANLLDDYEEGTWTPVIRDTSEAGTIVTVTANSCTYTKIGRIVTLVGSFTRSDAASLTGNLVITGLPFTATGGQQMGGNAWVDNTSGDILCQITAANTSTMLLRRVDAPDSFVTTDDWNNLRPIYFTRTYQTS
jgi:hypothetical protein